MTETLLIFAVFIILAALIVAFVLFLRWLDDRRLNRPRRVNYTQIVRHEYNIERLDKHWRVSCSGCNWHELVMSYAAAELEGELHAPTE